MEHKEHPMELNKAETQAVYEILQDTLDDLREVGDNPEWYATVEALFNKVNTHRYD